MIYEAEVTQRLGNGDYIVHANTSLNGDDLFVSATHVIDASTAIDHEIELEIGKKYRINGYINLGMTGVMMVRSVEAV